MTRMSRRFESCRAHENPGRSGILGGNLPGHRIPARERYHVASRSVAPGGHLQREQTAEVREADSARLVRRNTNSSCRLAAEGQESIRNGQSEPHW